MTDINSNESQTGPKRCKGTKKNGQPCNSTVLAPDGYCFTHSPSMADKRLEAWSRGGRNSATSVRLRGLVPPRLKNVYDTLEKSFPGKGGLPIKFTVIRRTDESGPTNEDLDRAEKVFISKFGEPVSSEYMECRGGIIRAKDVEIGRYDASPCGIFKRRD